VRGLREASRQVRLGGGRRSSTARNRLCPAAWRCSRLARARSMCHHPIPTAHIEATTRSRRWQRRENSRKPRHTILPGNRSKASHEQAAPARAAAPYQQPRLLEFGRGASRLVRVRQRARTCRCARVAAGVCAQAAPASAAAPSQQPRLLGVWSRRVTSGAGARSGRVLRVCARIVAT
jgi:hypothetical protein